MPVSFYWSHTTVISSASPQKFSFSCWMVVINPQNNTTFYQLLCLCCRYDLGTCVNQNGANIGMLDFDRRNCFVSLIKRKKICRGNPFYLTLISPWLLLTTLCCHWIFSYIIIFHFPDNLIEHAQCLYQYETMVKLLSLFLPILAKRLICCLICCVLMHNLYIKQCHSEIYISSTSCKYELKLPNRSLS